MATVLRPPVISPPQKRRDTTHGRQFVSAGLALLTAVALPVGKQVNQEPKRQRDHNQERQFTSAGLALRTFVALPVGKSVLEPPKLRRDTRAARDWTFYNQAALTPVVAGAPFHQAEWALPSRRRLDIADNAASIPLALELFPPFRQTDWALAKKVRLDLPDATFTESLSLAAQPFTQTDWTKAFSGRFSPATAYVNLAPLQNPAVVAAPFAQLDWPLADRIHSDTPDPIVANLLPLQPVVAPPVSHGYIKWTKPHRKRDAHAEILASCPAGCRRAAARGYPARTCSR